MLLFCDSVFFFFACYVFYILNQWNSTDSSKLISKAISSIKPSFTPHQQKWFLMLIQSLYTISRTCHYILQCLCVCVYTWINFHIYSISRKSMSLGLQQILTHRCISSGVHYPGPKTSVIAFYFETKINNSADSVRWSSMC